MTEWRLDDGQIGYGMSEYFDRIVDGQPADWPADAGGTAVRKAERGPRRYGRGARSRIACRKSTPKLKIDRAAVVTPLAM